MISQDLTLYEHQRHGIEFLLSKQVAVLGDEMGLGKTLQAIVACSHLLDQGEIDEVLVVCPRSLKLNWFYEIIRFTNYREDQITLVEGSPLKRQRQLSMPGRRWLIINYEGVRIEDRRLLTIYQYRSFAMICDESHKIKNARAQQSKCCLAVGQLAQRRYLLSGTFVANKPEDVWHQVKFLDGGELLGNTFTSFKRAYCIEQEFKFGNRYVSKIVDYKNLDDLRDRIGTLMLRRTKKQCLDLPDKVIQKIPIQMTSKQKTFYDKICKGIITEIGAELGTATTLSLTNVLTKMIYALQVASNPALVDPQQQVERLSKRFQQSPDQRLQEQIDFWQNLQPLGIEESAKVLALDDLLESYCEEQKVVLWSNFVGNIELLAERYQYYQPVVFYGKTKHTDRDQAVERFNNEESCRLFIANPQAAGLGLTLVSSSLSIFFDRNFSTVDYHQAVDRIHRIGQTKVCHILIMQTQKSVDQFIDFIIRQKTELSDFLHDQRYNVSEEILKNWLMGNTTGGKNEKSGDLLSGID